MHPSSLRRTVSPETLDTLLDPFFSARGEESSDGLHELVVDSVPDTDEYLTARNAHRQELRMQAAALAASAKEAAGGAEPASEAPRVEPAAEEGKAKRVEARGKFLTKHKKRALRKSRADSAAAAGPPDVP